MKIHPHKSPDSNNFQYAHIHFECENPFFYFLNTYVLLVAFESARGHTMERPIYINELHNCLSSLSTKIREEDYEHDLYRSRSPSRIRSQLTNGRQCGNARMKRDNFYDDDTYDNGFYVNMRNGHNVELSCAKNRRRSRSPPRKILNRSRNGSIPPEDQIDWTDY